MFGEESYIMVDGLSYGRLDQWAEQKRENFKTCRNFLLDPVQDINVNHASKTKGR